jgi:hypothetical protein
MNSAATLVPVLFVVHLTALPVAQTEASNERMIVNNEFEKKYGRKQSWPNFGYHPGFCVERLRKTTKQFSQDSPFPFEI